MLTQINKAEGKTAKSKGDDPLWSWQPERLGIREVKKSIRSMRGGCGSSKRVGEVFKYPVKSNRGEPVGEFLVAEEVLGATGARA